jgi:hypothetical protein
MSKKSSFLIVLLISVMSFFGQNHATVAKLTVSYKPVSTTSVSNLGDIKCTPQATITLKSNHGATKIYFKIVNPQNNAVVYQVDYLLNSSAVTDESGITLFNNLNGTIRIGYAQGITLKPYIYQIQTADSQNTMSTVFSQTN